MVRSIAACLLLVGSVAVSGVSAAAAPAHQHRFWIDRYSSGAEAHAEARAEVQGGSARAYARAEVSQDSEDAQDDRDTPPERRHRGHDSRGGHGDHDGGYGPPPEEDIQLDASFFLGGMTGGTGADPAFTSGGGGGGAFVEASAGASAHASAFASARASVSVRTGGGHPHGRPLSHGCGCRR